MTHGSVACGVTLHWLERIFGFGMVPLVAILAFFSGLFGLGYVHLPPFRSRPWLHAVAVATLWTAIEFFRAELFVLRFPWVTPGVAFGPNLLSPVVGVYGVSFVVVLAMAVLADRRIGHVRMTPVAAVLLLGILRPGPVEPQAGRALHVLLVQSEASQLDRYLSLTRGWTGGEVNLVVWPEYALPYDVRARPSEYAAVCSLAPVDGPALLVGTQTATGPGERDWRNTALWLEDGRATGEYYKNRTVHFFNDGIAGVRPVPLKTKLGRVGTPICFDCDFSGVVRRLTLEGAEFLAVPSFDAREWSVLQHRQHAELFRLRAAENRRWLACAASSGRTQIIDPNGHVRAALPLMEEGVLAGRIGRETRRTVFTQVGWLFPWLTLGACTGWIVWKAAWGRTGMQDRRVAR
jgi:apolipoprotein N-acyltransferase